jgi:hypothetical protein
MRRLTRKGTMASVMETPKRGNAGPIVFVACAANGITDGKTGIDEQAFLRLRRR